MDTETLDKLYLEWSQFTEARTAREIRLVAAVLWLSDHEPKLVDIAVKKFKLLKDLDG